ncbi:MAG: ParB N-terminal domain-containing protein [Gammaproteobacteria bacterium]|nr:ParB N-terminal domain-containing protein [Gammaproteobacteria bacterium]
MTATETPAEAPDRRHDVVHVEAFDPEEVRPWRYHNRTRSGMDDQSLDALAASIRRDGQQQLGLARRLPAGDTYAAEAIYGVRRLEACRRAEMLWRAEVRDASTPDATCAVLMHSENEWSEGVSPLENAAQWKAMLDAGVFANQSSLAVDLGCHRGTVSRAIRTVTTLFDEDWLERLVRPVMHEFTGRAADRLADACSDTRRRRSARQRAKNLVPGLVPAQELYGALFGRDPVSQRREMVFVRRKGRAGGGVVAAKIERDGAGGFNVSVRPHDQTPAELAEIAEQVEALLATETAAGSSVRLGRRLVALMTPLDAKSADRSWVEGCIWSAARASGLQWDRWRCAAAADILRSQPRGWENAVLRAITDTSSSTPGPQA